MYSFQVNTDGVISFGAPVMYSSHLQSVRSLGSTRPVVAPYWSDVDTRGNSSVYYR